MVDCPRDDIRDLLPDLVHDQLDPAARARVEQHLAECAECASELEIIRSLRATEFVTPDVDVHRIAAAVRAAVAGAANGDVPAGEVLPIAEARRRHARTTRAARQSPGMRDKDSADARAARWSIPQSWRIAAGIALVAAGAGGYALTRGSDVRSLQRVEESGYSTVASASAPAAEANRRAAKTGAPAGTPAGAPTSSADATSGETGVSGPGAAPTAPLMLGDAVNDLSESDMQALIESVDDLQAMPDLEPQQLPLLASVVEGAL